MQYPLRETFGEDDLNLLNLFMSQLADPFRIGLLIALTFTIANTRATTGVLVPSLAGIAFVAALIPMTLHQGQPFMAAFATGLVANALILGVVMALRGVALRMIRG